MKKMEFGSLFETEVHAHLNPNNPVVIFTLCYISADRGRSII